MAWSMSFTRMQPPRVSIASFAILARSRSRNWRLIAAPTRSARWCDGVSRMGLARRSCSACASRSAATVSGSALSSAMIIVSVGP